jgi:microcystin-dependent protein
MAEPFLSEIRIMSFAFPPKGWALCNGQLLPINQNQALFALLGTTFGGNGQVNFALPNLQGRTPIHVGNRHNLGEAGGEKMHTLSINEMPMHTHVLNATNTVGNTIVPSNAAVFANVAPSQVFSGAQNLAAMHPSVVSNTGGSQPHDNMQPYLTLSFCIALQGIFPSRN